ncbi:MAG: SAM-dependent methyltransferase [Nitrosomonadaceae bacterium]|nr:SAM-dependent methyltransferase [Nitrosomonadaceae bacterium]|tara:strand:+ start:1893 stop:2624 length:732 start_codon:yes stop_codon:yes gene_type:complete
MPIQNQQQWFESYLGQYLLEIEQIHFDQVVMNIFGYNAIQIGFPQYDFLRTNRMPFKFCADTERGATLLASPDFLPIESNSIDLVVLPHVLEFRSNPHQVLREVQRILLAEGQVIICGFNPMSLWGVRKWFDSSKHNFPWNGNFITLPRLKDWLTLLDFEMTSGRVVCYSPPINQEKWLKRFNFMEHMGNRWWPISGGVYFLQAIKRTYGMRVIKPAWKNSLASKRRIAPATNKINYSITKKY